MIHNIFFLLFFLFFTFCKFAILLSNLLIVEFVHLLFNCLCYLSQDERKTKLMEAKKKERQQLSKELELSLVEKVDTTASALDRFSKNKWYIWSLEIIEDAVDVQGDQGSKLIQLNPKALKLHVLVVFFFVIERNFFTSIFLNFS